MKQLLFSILLCLFISSSSFAFSAVPTGADESGANITSVQKKKKPSSFKQFRKATEQKLGRKLGLIEKIGLWYYTKLFGNPDVDARKANNQALSGFILGLFSITILPLLAIPGFFLSNAALNKEEIAPGTLQGSSYSFAKIGRILSIVGFVLLLLYIVYIAVMLGIYS